MQTEASVEVERGVRLSRTRNRDRRAPRVVVLVRIRNNDIEAVHRAAEENHDQPLFAGAGVLDRPTTRSE